ncbi:MAG: YciI family protein [Pseudomonadota bacterium]
MVQYIVYCVDKPGALDLRMANRPAHLDWARSFEDRILMAGPMFAPDGETFAGSVFVIEGESLEAIEAWAAEDPYAKAGLFERVDIRPCKWVIGDGKRA